MTASEEGEKERAAGLLHLILGHPAAEKETKDQATRLLAELKAELPSDAVVAAQEKCRLARLRQQ